MQPDPDAREAGKQFLSQIQTQLTPIHILIGLMNQPLLKIHVERFVATSGRTLVHSWLAPSIGFYQGGLTD